MSSTINASTASGGGVITTADASGILQLQTAGVTGLTIDASQNVGIGTSSPVDKLQIEGNIYLGTTGRTIYQGGSADLTLQVNTGVTKFLRANGVSESMRLDSSGNLLVGCTSVPNVGVAGQYGFSVAPTEVVISKNVNSCALYIRNVGGGAATAALFYNGTSQVGSITTSTTATAFNTGSDIRLKENIIDAPSALSSVNAIKVRSFDWKVDGSHQEYGYIAQELLEVAPEVVSVPSDEDEMMGVDFGRLTPRLVKAIQELKAIIDTQNARIEALEAK